MLVAAKTLGSPPEDTFRFALAARIQKIVDQHHFDADPDPARRLDADAYPVPTFHFDANPDPDPDPNFQLKVQTLVLK